MSELHPSWTATDDEVTVPVRSGSTSSTQPTSMTSRTASDDALSPRTRRIAAVTGMLSVIIVVGLAFGVLDLRGSILGGTSSKGLEITSDGFRPNHITVSPGETIDITNTSGVPHILKPRQGEVPLVEAVAIIDAEPVSVVVPMDAVAGTYTYVSSTLAEEKMLTITVLGAKDAAQTPPKLIEGATIPAAPEMQEIPLPFEATALPSGTQDTAEISVQATQASAQEVAMIALQGGAKDELPQMEKQLLPTNPHTQGAPIASESMHGGAPLLAERTQRVPQIAETGPALWSMLMCGLLALYVCWKKNLT